jgi:O-methyltransferase/methyltransferase family protein
MCANFEDLMDLKTQMNQLIRGYWTTQAIFVAAELGIADLLADGPKDPNELGKATGVKGDMLYRVLRALASIGIFAEDSEGRFMLTPLAETLRDDSGQRAYARLHGGELYRSWSKLLDAVRSGKAGFVEAFGMPAFEYFSKNTERGAVFDKAMTGHHGTEADPMMDAYDFSGFQNLVDVGGGNGSLLTAILKRHSQMRGILFDLPAVVERARSSIVSSGLQERCQVVGGSFLDAVPPGGDAYLLRHVLHDWRDEDSATILRRCWDAMKPDGKVLVVEIVVPAGNDPSFAKWMDLMMVTYGGKERSEKQYRELFAQADLRLTRVVPTGAGISVIEGVRNARN